MKLEISSSIIVLSILIGCAGHQRITGENSWEYVDLSVNSDVKIVSQDPDPKYPKEAMAERKSGFAVVTLMVDEFGKPRDIAIIKESPEGIGFGPSAVKQASKLKFVPAVLNGKRISRRVKRTYNFDYNSTGKSYSESKGKDFTSYDLTNCTDPKLSFWASRVRRAAYLKADSIASVDSVGKSKCRVRFIVDQSGAIFNLEKNGCEIGYKSIQKIERTPPLPAGFKPDTIMVSLEFDPNQIK